MNNGSAAPGLSPAQDHAFQWLKAVRGYGPVFCLDARRGMGRTTVARALAAEFGAVFLSASEFVESMKGEHPLKLEEQWVRTILEPLRERKAVVVDDFDAADFMSSGCRSYPRAGYLDGGMRVLYDEATRLGAWLLL